MSITRYIYKCSNFRMTFGLKLWLLSCTQKPSFEVYGDYLASQWATFDCQRKIAVKVVTSSTDPGPCNLETLS